MLSTQLQLCISLTLFRTKLASKAVGAIQTIQTFTLYVSVQCAISFKRRETIRL